MPNIRALLIVGVVCLELAMSGGCIAAPSWIQISIVAGPDDHPGFLSVPDDSRFSASFRCRESACGEASIGCVLRTSPRKPQQWKDDDVEALLPFMSEAGLQFFQIELDLRRAYGAIGPNVRASSIVFTSAATSSVAKLTMLAAAELTGRADITGQNLPVHVLDWIKDHTPQGRHV